MKKLKIAVNFSTSIGLFDSVTILAYKKPFFSWLYFEIFNNDNINNK